MEVTVERSLEHDLFMVFGRSIHTGSREFQDLDADTIKKAFRVRAKQCHPDHAQALGFRPEILNHRFKELSAAHTRLLAALGRGTQHPGSRRDTEARGPISSAHGRNQATGFQPRQSAKPRHKDTAPGAGIYHRGPMPDMELRLVQFLYYSSMIDWQTMCAALTWQYLNRPLLGAVAKDLGLLDDETIQSILRRKRRGEKFGAAATRLGYLEVRNLHLIVGRQRLYNMPIGKYFLDKGILGAGTLSRLLQDLQAHNIRCKARS